MPKDFLPSDDTGQLSRHTEAAQGTSFDADGRATQQQVAADRRAGSERRGVTSSVGGGSGGEPGPIVIDAEAARRERALSADEVIARAARRSWRDIPGIDVYRQNPPAISIGGRASTSSSYQYTLQGLDIDRAAARRRDARCERCRRCRASSDVTSDLQIAQPAGQGRHRPRRGRGARA